MNIGIIGAGRIAVKMAHTLNKMSSATAYAIASRSLEKAEAFAKEHHVIKAYGSYEQMVSDPDVHLVYVATPHSHHFDQVKLALEHGKPVLCEKAFTLNATQAKALIEISHKKNVLLAEAIWPKYLPIRTMLDEVIDSGIIGEVTSVTANLGFYLLDKERVTNPLLAGGALLDLGAYAINLALMAIKSDIKNIESSATFLDTGVDAQNSAIVTFEDDKVALLHSTQLAYTDKRGMLFGSKGYLELVDVTNPQSIKVFDKNYQLVKELARPEQITGFEYQVQACIDAINAGEIECKAHPHSEILRVMNIMDEMRRQWGMHYPMECN